MVRKPKPADPREVALMALLGADQGRFPEEALEAYGHRLDRRDRALAFNLVFGVLRWQSLLDWTIRQFLSKPGKSLDPAVSHLLRMGLYQIRHLDRIPPSAAINTAVRLAKIHAPRGSSGLVNAVLRNILRSDALPEPDPDKMPEEAFLAVSTSHPAWLVRRYLDRFGPEETRALLQANNTPPPLTLRVNTRKTDRTALMDRLSTAGIAVEETRFSPVGVRISGPVGPVTDLPGFAEGHFAVQDEASQVVGLLAAPKAGERVLDACAGRGGKSFHLAEQAGARVWAMEPHGGRLAEAQVEMKRLGADNLEWVRGDLLTALPFGPGSFDLVLVDAPCSNLGVIRRRPDVKWNKTDASIRESAALQLSLLRAASRLVKPEGRIVYAVCTVTGEETMGVTDPFWMEDFDFGLRPASLFLPESADSLIDRDGVVRSWPHRHGTDGFYAAVYGRKVAKPPDF